MWNLSSGRVGTEIEDATFGRSHVVCMHWRRRRRATISYSTTTDWMIAFLGRATACVHRPPLSLSLSLHSCLCFWQFVDITYSGKRFQLGKGKGDRREHSNAKSLLKMSLLGTESMLSHFRLNKVESIELNTVCHLFQVKIWFQNRRMKWRNSKERELIAHGGSREQTLPTKHNPNPDLSDPVASPAAAAASATEGSSPGGGNEQSQSAAAATQSLHRIWSEAAAAAAAAAATPFPPLPPPPFAATSAAERMRLVAMQATDDADANSAGCGADEDCEDGDVDGGSDGGGVGGVSDDSEDEMEEINVT